MNKSSKIYIAGHNGLVGSAILRQLQKEGFNNLVYKTKAELNLLDSEAVKNFFAFEEPEYVFLAAAKVGGIHANNTLRGDFIYQNLQIQNNIIHNAYQFSVKKLIFLGSSCIYPKNCIQPIKEEYLLSGDLEYTNEPYALAKIAGIKMCESYNLQYGTNFISVMPTNLYGINDNFDLNNSHVLPAMIRKLYLARLLEEGKYSEIARNLMIEYKSNEYIHDELLKYDIRIEDDKVVLQLWGSGKPYREFLHVDDLADAVIYVMQYVNFEDLTYNMKDIKNTHINIGTGVDLTIRDLAIKIKDLMEFDGVIQFDITKPDGTFRKLLDVSKINSLGWEPKISLDTGILNTINWYITQNSLK